MRTKAMMNKSLFFSRTADFLDEYLVRQCNRSEKTREAYRDALTIFKDYVISAGKSILTFLYVECTYEFVLGFKEYLSETRHYKPASINHRVAAIKSYLKYSSGCDTELVQIYISVRAVPNSTVPKLQRPVLEESDVCSLLQKPPATRRGLRDSLIMSLLFDTAIRLDELIRLKIGDIYEKDGYYYLVIHGKGRKDRKVSMDERTVDLLRCYLDSFHKKDCSPDRPLIYTVIKGEMGPMSHRNVQKMLKKYGKAAAEDGEGLTGTVHPHMLRRSRATGLYQNGVPIETVSRFLGHSSVETTRSHYAFASMEQLRRAINSGSTSVEEPLWKGHEDELSHMCGLR